ncbi:MAG: DnaD domain protein [Clostridia bacterium]|nr:DnaD domain protein [Clostridia bacterium]
MSAVMKVKLNYDNRIISLPYESVMDFLPDASKEELKLLVAVFACPEFDGKELSQKLDMTEKSFSKALKSLEKNGIISIDTEEDVNAPDSAEVSPEQPKKILKKTSNPNSYTPGELADIIETKPGCADLINSAQQILGRMFNTTDTSIIVNLFDSYNLSEEYILLLCSIAATRDRKTVREVEKLAIDYFDRNITTYEALENELKANEERKSLESFVRKLFGWNDRTLITKEKQIINNWATVYAYPRDLIKLAYEKTVSNISTPSLPYTDTILSNWYKEGLKTVEEVEKDIAKKTKKGQNSAKSSFDTSEYFAAAVKRSNFKKN